MLADLLEDLTDEDEPDAKPRSSQKRLEAAFARRTGWDLTELVDEAVAGL
jgi:hypothetical protein